MYFGLYLYINTYAFRHICKSGKLVQNLSIDCCTKISDMLESGEVKNLNELATREGVNNSHLSRMINLTLLSR